MSALNSLPGLSCVGLINRLLIFSMLSFCYSCTIANAEENKRLNFDAESIIKWEKKSFKGDTLYKIVTDDGKKVIQANSNGTASGLFHKVRLDPAGFRYLRWSWKIKHTIPKGYENRKDGDDYAARIYVVFPGKFVWQTKAINYIWANHLPKGQAIPNAFTSNAMMLAIESGSEQTGKWIIEKRDILADYRRLFGTEPQKIEAIAIMTDTDNTGDEATAWYGEISIASQ